MPSSVTDHDRGYDELLETLRAMKGRRHVVVGIRGEKGGQKAEGADATLVEIAAYNEFGTETIPERSFLRTTVGLHQREYLADLRAGAVKVVTNKATVDQVLDRLGVKAVGHIKERIGEGILPPNAASTIRGKTRAGRAGTTPLIDTGRLRNSIDHEVREG